MEKASASLKEEVSFEEIDFSEIDPNPQGRLTTPTADTMGERSSVQALRSVGEGEVGVHIGGLTVEDDGEGKLDTPASLVLAGPDFFRKYCCGWVNGGRESRVCLKPARELENGCQYQSHFNKFEIREELLLITLKVPKVGLCGLAEPVLPRRFLLEEDSLDDILHKEYPLATLVKFVTDRIDHAGSGPKTPRPPQTLRQVHVSFKEVQTPRIVENKIHATREQVNTDDVKGKLDFDTEAGVIDIDSLANSLEGLVMILEDSAVKDVLATVSRLAVMTTSHIRKLRESAGSTRAHTSELLDRIEEVFNFTQILSQRIGDPPQDDGRLSTTPMWKLIHAFADDISIGKGQVEVLSDIVGELRERSNMNNKNVRSVSEFVRTAIPSLQQRVLSLEQHKMTGEFPDRPHDNSAIRETIREVYAKMGMIESAQREMSKGIDPAIHLYAARISELETKLFSLQAASSGGGTYCFGDLKIQSAADVERELAEELPQSSIADFPELFGILCQISDKFTDGKTYADKSRSSTLWPP